MSAILQQPRFTDENEARKALEAARWPNGPICPHCGSMGRIVRVEGKSHRPGLLYCNDCREQFTVTVGTVMEHSKVPLTKWWMAIHLLGSSKKGISSHQLHRTLGVTYKTAWFMTHRIRLAMVSGGFTTPMGGKGKVVEADETVIGRLEGAPKSTSKMGGRSGYRNVALTLVERGGSARSFHVTGTTIAELKPIIVANIERETALMTDQAAWYPEIGEEFASHETVNHAKDEYARRDGERIISTNAVENFYSIFKRGMKGVYQHCGEKHLHRYLAEFDFRYSNRVKLGVDDKQRATKIAAGISGKRLTYRRPYHPDEAPPF
jgi:transposase-like protein